MKRILITGKNSYIGNSFKEWVSQWPEKYEVDEIDTRNGIWKKKSFSGYDSVLHVAGIAHIKETRENKKLYYKVNRDLAGAVAKKAKKSNVKQFILMSSMSVYGLSTGIIDQYTPLKPKNSYGKSKLEAERILKEMQNDNFSTVIVRPPMVYGEKSKGNYTRLAKLAKIIPVFPEIDNQRSMIYVDNLSEFIKLIVDQSTSGIYLPQNKEYVNTSEMVRLINQVHGKSIIMTKQINPFIKGLNLKILNKIFGSLVYESSMSEYKYNYNIFDFKESIYKSEV